jgi:chlorobactene glucosyltransferase
VLLFLLIGGIALFWVGVWAKVRKGRADTRFKLGPDAPVASALPRLTAVVPARDEARNIAACIAALRASDHPNLEILVFDDGSTDGTPQLAEAAGARVVRGGGEALPAGWKGKPWALHRAADHVDASWIVFIDADVRVAPEALSRFHTYAIRGGVDLVSGFGRLLMESFWEKVIQPSVGGLIIAGNDLSVVNDPEKPDKAIANGQLILVRRDAYAQVGGHAAVKDDILDDIGLALAFTRSGLVARCLFARELFSCRMYTGFSELWYGWTKNLYPGMRYRLDVVAVVIGMVLVEFLSPYVLLLYSAFFGTGTQLAAAAALVVLVHAVRYSMDRLFGQDPKFGLLQPLGAAMLIGLLVDSVRRTKQGTRLWKGRIY